MQPISFLYDYHSSLRKKSRCSGEGFFFLRGEDRPDQHPIRAMPLSPPPRVSPWVSMNRRKKVAEIALGSRRSYVPLIIILAMNSQSAVPPENQIGMYLGDSYITQTRSLRGIATTLRYHPHAKMGYDFSHNFNIRVGVLVC